MMYNCKLAVAIFCLSLLVAGTHAHAAKLHDLCMTGTLEQITEALKPGVNLNAKNGKGLTPLMIAVVYNQSPDVVAALIQAGANVKEKKGSETALSFALDPQKHVNKPRPYNPIVAGRVATLLLEAGAETKEIGKKMPGALNNYNLPLTAVDALIKSGVDVNAKSKDRDFTPLVFAIENVSAGQERIIIIQRLIDAGANVNAVDKTGHTVLMQAAKFSRSAEVVNVLITAGADVHATTKDGQTVLMTAVNNRNRETPELITALLQAGAKVDAKDKSGKTAADYARANDKPQSLAILLQADIKPNP